MNNINYMIRLKKMNDPYLATDRHSSTVVSEIDHFPYAHFFRGNYKSPKPIIMDREAGIVRYCKKTNINKPRVKPEQDNKPNLCFQNACTTIKPCYSNMSRRHSQEGQLNDNINNQCNIKYI